jgi:1-aminocyclopropane-1-carboxylate deaminase/D-cysteine desulfhydrase-like pyridoxal-dependent ACC family enzyme
MLLSSSFQTDVPHPYVPPAYIDGILRNVPKHGRLRLANLPTPIHRVNINTKSNTNVGNTKSNTNVGGDGSASILSRLAELNIKLYIKRDDATSGIELGGNKLRKLEFLLADALHSSSSPDDDEDYDSIVTIGGEQSNHCRATASACRLVGLEPHIILRTSRADDIHAGKDDMGYIGNLLFDRMVGSTIYTCTPREYTKFGSTKLIDSVCNTIRQRMDKPNNPYPITVGGSNAVGTWGYIDAVDEVIQQIITSDISTLDHVVFATGSGGTATGITLGLSLAYGCHGSDGHPAMQDKVPPRIHAVGVCDNPDYFYRTMSNIADEMGMTLSSFDNNNNNGSSSSSMTTEQFIREAVTVYNGKGNGYAVSTNDELDFITTFAIETGIVLDPVYTGKALYYFLSTVLEENPEVYRDTNILFWHTGGSIGLYDKGDDLLERMSQSSHVIRIDSSMV